MLFLPQTIATVVVAQAFTWIYGPTGPLNEFLRAVGLGVMGEDLARRLHLGAAGGRR